MKPKAAGTWRGVNLPRRQRGIAMLVAILLVALGTIVAAAVAYESAMSARRASATLSFDEALLIAQGAEGIAAYGLRAIMQSGQSGKNGGGTGDIYPAQPWAQPVELEVVPGVMLRAQLEDVSGRFNLNWLGVTGANGQADKATVDAFNKLLAKLGIETKWTDLIIDWIDQNQQPLPDGAEDSAYLGQNPPYLTANQFITSTSELLALPGFGPDRLRKLAPYVTALPPGVGLNICSARGATLDAFRKQDEYGLDEEAFEKLRTNAAGCFPSLTTYNETLATAGAGVQASRFTTKSQYFRLSSLVTIGTSEFNLYSLLYVDSQFRTHVIMRSYTPD